MSSAPSSIPPDDPKRSLTVAQPDNLTHIGLVGDTYTVTVTGEQTAGRFCVIDMHIPPGGGPPPHRHDFEEASKPTLDFQCCTTLHHGAAPYKNEKTALEM